MESNPQENLSDTVSYDYVTVQNHSVRGDNVDDDVNVDESNNRIELVKNLEEQIKFLKEQGKYAEQIMEKIPVLSMENVRGDNCDVYLVGTTHVSQESCKMVQTVIKLLKPQVVFLELCSSRMAILTNREFKVPTINEMLDMWKKKENVFGILYTWFLAKVSENLKVPPGSEFRVAYEEAVKCGSKVILGDRPVNITLRRTWTKLSLWDKTRLIYTMIFDASFLPITEDPEKSLKETDDVDQLTLDIQELSKEFPTLLETLLNERDQYMSYALLQIASEHTSVVAVVGKGHIPGILKNWNQPIQIHELLEIPSRSPVLSMVKVLSTVGVAVAGAAIVYGCFFASKKQS